MTTFVDSSALIAFIDRADPGNRRAVTTMSALLGKEDLLTHNYVVVESVAVVHRRLEPAAARDLLETLIPQLDVAWVDERTHSAAASAFLGSARRRTSLVDWVSFEIMRRRGIATAFAFDRDFKAQGFKVVP